MTFSVPSNLMLLKTLTLVHTYIYGKIMFLIGVNSEKVSVCSNVSTVLD